MNLISPYGVIAKYEYPPLKGFFLHPKSDEADAGWTVTTNENTGEVNIPGTPGGGGTYRFIGWGLKGGAGWKVHHTPGDFFYGEIDWVGKQKNPDLPTHGKYRLSYHGPNTRYFGTDQFTYGSSSDHNNIYMEGRCIAVAPYPVLGAALRIEKEEPTPDQVEEGAVPRDVLVLVAVCLDGSEEKVLRKVIPSFSYGVTRTKYTDEFRKLEMEMFDDEDFPLGWEMIGSFSITEGTQHGGATLESPRVPWFFNESGTRAVCVRECSVKITIDGTEETQESYHKFSLTVSDGARNASYDDEGQDGPGFTVRVATKATRAPDWVNETKWPNTYSPKLTHKWAVVDIRQHITMNGYIVVASDFRGDEEVNIKYQISHYTRQNHFMYRGIDTEENIPEGYASYRNTNDIYGDVVYVNSLNLTVDMVQNPYGVTVPTILQDEEAFLVFPGDEKHHIYRRFSGTRSMFETGESDPNDPYTFFVFTLTQYPHVADLRQPYIASFIDYMVYAGYSTPLKDQYKYEQIYTGNTEDYTVIHEVKSPQSVTPPIHRGFDWRKVWAPVSGAVQGQYVWDTEHIKEYTVLDALWYTSALSAGRWPETAPNPTDFYENSTVYKFDTDMLPIKGILQSSSNGYRKLGSGRDDHGNLAFSMEYRNAEGELKYYNYLDNGSMDSLTKASGPNTRFFSIGVS